MTLVRVGQTQPGVLCLSRDLSAKFRAKANRGKLALVKLISCIRLAVGAAVFALASTGVAQVTDPTLLASRRALIDRATAARNGGRHPEALELAQRAAQIQMTPSLRLFIMQAQTQVGQLAEAYSSAIACQSEASRDTAASAQTITRLCTESINTLQARVGRVAVTVSPAVEGLHVFVGNRELHSALLGQDYVVTPGEVSIRVEAAGYRTVSRTVTVNAAASLPIQIALERDVPTTTTDNRGTTSTTGSTTTSGTAGTTAPTTTATTTTTSGATSGADGSSGATTSSSASGASAGSNSDDPSDGATVPPPTGPEDQRRRLNVGAVATMATGGGLVVLGAVFTGLGAAAAGEYNTLCTPQCTQANVAMGRAAYDRGNMFLGMGIAGLAVGGATAVGGLVWMLVARPSAAPARTAWVTPTQNGAMIGFGGTL